MKPEKAESPQDLNSIKDSIWRSLNIMQKAIDVDNKALAIHLERFGDLYYRHPDEENKKSELILVPLAAKMRLELKSLLECIAIIDQKLGGREPKQNDEEEEGEFDPKAYLNEGREN